LKQVDVVRIDHFRGFEANWEIPAGEPTAEHGRWVLGPGYDLFDTLREKLGRLPIIAEDLGIITPAVNALRTHYDFPGMRILQFAFAGAVEERFLPHNYNHNTIVYTGTHDNDTTLGWFRSATAAEQAHLAAYAGHPLGLPSWELMRLAWASVAVLAVAPLQDVLSLGSQARMNTPGQSSGWWRWRFRWEQINDRLIKQLREMTELYDRD
jgi:4-alpha-glucanotransferase